MERLGWASLNSVFIRSNTYFIPWLEALGIPLASKPRWDGGVTALVQTKWRIPSIDVHCIVGCKFGKRKLIYVGVWTMFEIWRQKMLQDSNGNLRMHIHLRTESSTVFGRPVPRMENNSFQNLLMHLGAQSDMITSGIPSSQNTLSTNSQAYWVAVTSLVHSTIWVIFVKRSTNTEMPLLPLDSGKSVTSFVVICYHALSGIGIGCKTPAFFGYLFSYIDKPDKTAHMLQCLPIDHATNKLVWWGPPFGWSPCAL